MNTPADYLHHIFHNFRFIVRHVVSTLFFYKAVFLWFILSYVALFLMLKYNNRFFRYLEKNILLFLTKIFVISLLTVICMASLKVLYLYDYHLMKVQIYSFCFDFIVVAAIFILFGAVLEYRKYLSWKQQLHLLCALACVHVIYLIFLYQIMHA